MQSKEIKHSQQQHCGQPGPGQIHKYPAGSPVYPRMGINSLHCQASPWQQGFVTCSFLALSTVYSFLEVYTMTGNPVKQAGGVEGALLSSHVLISHDRPLILSFAETEQGDATAPLQGLSELILPRGTGRYLGMMPCWRSAPEKAISMALPPLPSM